MGSHDRRNGEPAAMVTGAGVVGLVARVFCVPHVWGQSDCCTAASDVFADLHGIDPMAPLRGTYASAEQAAAAVAALGGWRKMCAALADQAGLTPSGWSLGGLALVRLPDGGRGLAIGYPGGVWAAKIEGAGFVTLPENRKVLSWVQR